MQFIICAWLEFFRVWKTVIGRNDDAAVRYEHLLVLIRDARVSDALIFPAFFEQCTRDRTPWRVQRLLDAIADARPILLLRIESAIKRT